MQPLALGRIVEGRLIVGIDVLAILLGLALGQECFEPLGLGLDDRPDLLLERSTCRGSIAASTFGASGTGSSSSSRR